MDNMEKWKKEMEDRIIAGHNAIKRRDRVHVLLFVLAVVLAVVFFAGETAWTRYVKASGVAVEAEVVDVNWVQEEDAEKYYVTFRLETEDGPVVRERRYAERVYEKLAYKPGDAVTIYYLSGTDTFKLLYVVDGEETVRRNAWIMIVAVLMFFTVFVARILRRLRK